MQIAELKGHSDRVWAVSWHPRQLRLASCSGDKAIKFWKGPAEAGGAWDCVTSLANAHARTVRSVSYNHDGSFIASGSFDATTAVWEPVDGGVECLATLEGHENEVKSVAWSASNSLLATCSRDKSVWIWEGCVQVNSATGDGDFECIAVLQEHKEDVKVVKWHPSFEILASGSYDNTIRLWRDNDDEDWACYQILEGHTSTVWSIDFNPSGDMLGILQFK